MPYMPVSRYLVHSSVPPVQRQPSSRIRRTRSEGRGGDSDGAAKLEPVRVRDLPK